MDSLEIEIFDSPEDLHSFVSDNIIEFISTTLSHSNRCSLSFSGGTSPRKIYEKIGKTESRLNIDWASVHFFWGDERCVPPDNELSNYRMVHEALLSAIEIPPDNIHRIKGELGPEESASIYEKELRQFFLSESLPKIDLMLLGLGEDTHTASLFPFSTVLKENDRWAAAVHKEHGPHRVTLTLPAINNSRTIFVIVTGKNKADAIYRVFFSSFDPYKYPAQAVKPKDGNLFWFIDKDAASLYLEKSGRK